LNKMMKVFSVLTLGVASVSGAAIELSMENYEKKMSGMNVFVKFLAPW